MPFVYIVSQGNITSPHVECMGFTADPEYSRAGPGKRTGYTIHYNLKGKGYFNGNTVFENQGFLVRDGMYAEHLPDANEPWELLWITISGVLCENVFSRFCENKSTGIFDFPEKFPVREIAERICRCDSISLDSFAMLEMLLKLCPPLPLDGKANAEGRAAQIYVDFAVKYIKDNLQRNITVENLVKLTGVSQPYLYRLFRERYGISPKGYILEQKMSCAKDLLLTTDMTVTEIANSVGYEDVLAFSAVFSKKEGISATGYRKSANL